MEISEKQNKKIEEVAKKHHLKLALLFGSRVDGKIHKESDFDVAYLSNKKLSYGEENYLNVDFTGIFMHARDRVDTIDMRKVSPLMLFGVFRKCQVLYAKDNLIFPTYRAYAFKKYMEIKPFLEKQLKNKLKDYDI